MAAYFRIKEPETWNHGGGDAHKDQVVLPFDMGEPGRRGRKEYDGRGEDACHADGHSSGSARSREDLANIYVGCGIDRGAETKY